MPPLRSKRLAATRKLITDRYRNRPVEVRLAPRARPHRLGSPAKPPQNGKRLFCPVDANGNPTSGPRWNVKRLIGRPLGKAEQMADSHDCALRVLWIDGMTLTRTSDLLYHRVNVAVRDGRIVRILGIG